MTAFTFLKQTTCVVLGVFLLSGTSVLAASEKSVPEQLASMVAQIQELSKKIDLFEHTLVKKSDFEALKQTVAAQQKAIDELRNNNHPTPPSQAPVVKFKLKVTDNVWELTPLPNIRVIVNDATGTKRYTAISGADGKVAFDLPPGQYWYTYEVLDANGDVIETTAVRNMLEGNVYVDQAAMLEWNNMEKLLSVPMIFYTDPQYVKQD
ncbi:carboxypeptidase-like regulatory domain-containing protein [Paenibacillus mucilaginosus]|uniref:Uncharacterized protein n=1 Tax=Paenibacillus mucilaginosus (strain KNP414) TaxID=1036673 RepID=F8F540_PAEMK|nr:carboxypeptidase-like regulatory domain-containing protein [Paenibacillus mucilaginosus]AEI40770.1 hypothetical protein KNP414_02209 [Paenibacillus mucilaginosus KNP414]MCG7211752.1 carboxypeptidase-like regulatory domain-containing protein [Paenibacillus mucilaginosus]WDM29895.1 carboxypeptidase regulatory-like domain-containing protein [Paenibacillus mucilaginosus]